jgi:hypothetical protein
MFFFKKAGAARGIKIEVKYAPSIDKRIRATMGEWKTLANRAAIPDNASKLFIDERLKRTSEVHSTIIDLVQFF